MSNNTPEREALAAEAKRLAHRMMRDSWASGDDASWQPACTELHAAIDALAASPAAGGVQPVPDVSDLLVLAVECGVIRLSKVMDPDLQDALTAFARSLLASQEGAAK